MDPANRTPSISTAQLLLSHTVLTLPPRDTQETCSLPSLRTRRETRIVIFSEISSLCQLRGMEATFLAGWLRCMREKTKELQQSSRSVAVAAVGEAAEHKHERIMLGCAGLCGSLSLSLCAHCCCFFVAFFFFFSLCVCKLLCSSSSFFLFFLLSTVFQDRRSWILPARGCDWNQWAQPTRCSSSSSVPIDHQQQQQQQLQLLQHWFLCESYRVRESQFRFRRRCCDHSSLIHFRSTRMRRTHLCGVDQTDTECLLEVGSERSVDGDHTRAGTTTSLKRTLFLFFLSRKCSLAHFPFSTSILLFYCCMQHVSNKHVELVFCKAMDEIAGRSIASG